MVPLAHHPDPLTASRAFITCPGSQVPRGLTIFLCPLGPSLYSAANPLPPSLLTILCPPGGSLRGCTETIIPSFPVSGVLLFFYTGFLLLFVFCFLRKKGLHPKYLTLPEDAESPHLLFFGSHQSFLQPTLLLSQTQVELICQGSSHHAGPQGKA